MEFDKFDHEWLNFIWTTSSHENYFTIIHAGNDFDFAYIVIRSSYTGLLFRFVGSTITINAVENFDD